MRLPKPLDVLDPAQQQILSDALSPVRFAAGACLFREGEPGDGCYIIGEGEVRVEFARQEHTDSERVLAYVTAGMRLGALSLLDGAPRSASAFAETEVVASWLSAAAVTELCAQHPQ